MRRTAAAPSADAALSADQLHYSLIVEWSDEDAAYIVTVPELPGCRTHGETYARAIARAQEAIESWVESAIADGASVPAPRQYQHRSFFADA